jgi:alkylation response protein AidB-like acyl-CoA dehydrogenase
MTLFVRRSSSYFIRNAISCHNFTTSTSTVSSTVSDALNRSKRDFFNPTEEHAAFREVLRDFVEKEVDPQAKEYNRKEIFNYNLFKKLGSLGMYSVAQCI